MVVTHEFRVPTEAYAFLGAVAAFLLLLILFFCYLHKKLCFSECGGFPCCDEPPKKEKTSKLGPDGQPIKKKKKLDGFDGSAYAYEEQDTSSDSDDEVLRRYQHSIQQQSLKRASSQRSVRSSKSARSQKSALSSGKKKDQQQKDPDAAAGEDLISLAEKGIHHGSRDELDGGEPKPQGGAGERRPGPGTEDGGPHGEHTNGAYGGDSELGSSRELSLAEQEEQLFDVSDLQGDQEPPLISKCGSLEVGFSYNANKGRMEITVFQARDIPTKDRGGANSTQVRVLLLPTKKQRHKTKIKQGENPVFSETFTFNKIPAEEANNFGIRFRLYGCERMRRERMIGESIVGFASLNLDMETSHWLTLEPRSNIGHGDSKVDLASLSRSDSASSTQSMQHGGMPELLIGLAYNGTTGRLSVEVIKGSNFRNMAMQRAPDTYVKLTLMSPNGQEIARSKTSIRRGQPNPLYKETFMFQVALFQLPDVTLMTSVYNKRSMKRKEMIGWFSLGLNNSGEEELSHWNDMRESKGEQVCRWHVLLES